MSLHLSLNLTPKASEMESRLAQLANGGAEAIGTRLDELDREWSAGRVGKSILAVGILVGTILAITENPYWMILPIVAGLFLLQYMFAHNSLLVKLVQPFGFRRRSEIEQEKFALRTLRGDFRMLPTILDIEDADDIARLEGEGGLVVEDDERKVDSREAVKEVLEAGKPKE